MTTRPTAEMFIGAVQADSVETGIVISSSLEALTAMTAGA